MKYINNFDSLTDHGFIEERKMALECLDVALEAANTYIGTKKAVRIEGDVLWAGRRKIDLKKVGRIFVIGAGKGSYPIVKALDEILGDRIVDGVVSVKGEIQNDLRHITMIIASHPVPDEASLEAGARIFKIAKQLKKNDVVFTCITGGCSSLMVLPVEGVSLQDKQEMNRLLLEIGAPIFEINTVRKHISLIKGGGLFKMLQPAQVITLTQDTTPEQLPWPDPVLPDPSTFSDAIEVLQKYEIWERIPVSIKNYLIRGTTDPSLETMKSNAGIQHTIIDTGNQRNACLAAVKYARSKNYHAHVLSTKIEGESKDVGSVLAGIAKEIQQYGRPFKTPCVVVSAGETRVTLNGTCGKGGPNQELVLGFGLNIKNYDNIVLASIDSEGTDGPTEIAGGIVDSATVKRAQTEKVDLFGSLKTHDSSNALERLGDAVLTGPTGTNVVNLRVLVIGKKE